MLVYTFNARFNLTFKLVRTLDNSIDKYFIRGSEGVYSLIKKILQVKPDCVLGLGDYRRNAKKICSHAEKFRFGIR